MLFEAYVMGFWDFLRHTDILSEELLHVDRIKSVNKILPAVKWNLFISDFGRCMTNNDAFKWFTYILISSLEIETNSLPFQPVIINPLLYHS